MDWGQYETKPMTFNCSVMSERSGTPVGTYDFTNVLSLSMTIHPSGVGAFTGGGTFTVVQANPGTLIYSPVANDFATPGMTVLTIKATYPSYIDVAEPLTLNVLAP